MQNFVFQDNIYQLVRSIDVVYEGLQLDLADELFFNKIINDITFFDFAIQKLVTQIEHQSHLPDYLTTMHCLFSCITRYTNLLNFYMQKVNISNKKNNEIIQKLKTIHKRNSDVQNQIATHIQETNTSSDSYQIVSQNELSELLDF
ncbi:hypothetical protein DWQ65_05765 [Treponema phagedenis]|uniref:Uncharacterized protein n=1 Tax=Treponema phagedenis TaxID=162 RepID=A0A0B7GQN5_TREPH|nr:hypothetical protein [Treponema phagedenis]EFW38217.1 hypothetical protein HMPREF9554_01286 [Treponema phagedenis F0421]NVP24608.1 hypothetical protein [Treponema phagedenis]QEJ94700.1 hypothetical protein FUT79_05420 [Treponema phagedenis]QEJ97636.1 hypothetical protein FUT82_06270 [Treponema phagedenis]QEK00604.1 hypothetical protein FUT84_05105 [Treponema phagedenis]